MKTWPLPAAGLALALLTLASLRPAGAASDNPDKPAAATFPGAALCQRFAPSGLLRGELEHAFVARMLAQQRAA